MKQTKSALTMLLAHYRAIYKHAILAAFVAASTLGAGSASADALAKGTTIDVKGSETKEITEAWDNGKGGTTVESITIAANGKLTAKTATTTAAGSLVLTNSAKTDIQGTLEVVANTTNFDLTINSKELTVGSTGSLKTEANNKLTLSATDKATIGGTIDNSGTITIDSSETTISGLNVKASGDAGNTNFTGAKTILSGTNTITKGNVNFKGANTSLGGTLDIVKDGAVAFGKDAKTLEIAAGTKIQNAGSIDFGTVKADLSSATLEGKGAATGKGVITGSDLTITTQQVQDYVKATSGSIGSIKIADKGILNINQKTGETGSFVLDGKFAAGASVSDGKINLASASATGTVNIDNATITAAALGSSLANLSVNVQNLTLGNGSAIFETSDFSGLAKIRATQSLDVKTGAKLLDNLTLSTIKPADSGRIIGSGDIKIEHASNALTIANGNWTSDVDIIVGNGTNTAGKLVIGGGNDGDRVSLSFAEGKGISLKGGSGVGTLEINNTEFDLTKSQIFKEIGTGSKIDIKGKGKLITTGEYAKTELSKAKIGLTTADSTLSFVDDLELGKTQFANFANSNTQGKLEGKNLVIDAEKNALTIELNALGAGLDFDSITINNTGESANNKLELKKATVTVSNAISVSNATGSGVLNVGDSAAVGADAANAATLNLHGNGIVDASKLVIGKNSTVDVKGNWTTTGTLDTNAGTTVNTTGKDVATVQFNKGSSLTTQKLATSAGDLIVTGDGSLVVSGIKDEIGDDGTITAGQDDIKLTGKVSVENGANLTIGKDAISDLFTAVKAPTETPAQEGEVAKPNIEFDKDFNFANIVGKATSSLTLDLDNTYHFTDADLKELRKTKLTAFEGFINLGQASFDGEVKADEKTGRYDYDKVENLLSSKFTNVDLSQGVIEVQQAKANSGVSGSVGAIYVNSMAPTGVNIKADTVLNNASANNNLFASKVVNGKVEVADAKVAAAAGLVLNNGGQIGNVTLADKSTLEVYGKGKETVLGDIKDAKNGKAIFGSGSVKAGAVDVADASFNGTSKATLTSLKTNNLAVKGSNINVAGNTNLTVAANQYSTIDSSNFTTDSLTLAVTSPDTTKVGDLLVANGGSLVVDSNTKDSGKLTAANGVVAVGFVADEDNTGVVNPALKAKETYGSLFVRDASAFKGDLVVESGTAGKSSLAVIGTGVDKTVAPTEPLFFSTRTLAQPLAIVNDTEIGQNGVVALGYNSLAEAQADLKTAGVMTDANGALQKGLTSVALVNTQVDLGANILNVGKIENPAAGTTATVSLANNSALVLTNSAFENQQNAAILLDTTKGGTNTNNGANVEVETAKDKDGKDAAKVLLAGNFTTTEVKKNGYKVFAANATPGSQGVKIQGTLKVESLNGLMEGEVGADGSISKYGVSKNFRSKLNMASVPVQDYIKGIADGTIKDIPQAKDEKGVLVPYAENVQNMIDFTNSLPSTTNGIDFEQSARFAVYGGSVKAAELAAKAGYEAVQGYAENTVAAATVQNEMGSFFVVPTYKSSDSDSFNAEGLDFGSDINLSGVALGADFVVAPAIKLGVMFNIGTGDSKGQGIAQGVESDLDYVGGGLFARYEENGINVVADLSYTQSSAETRADVQATGANYNKFTADADTKAISLGVKGSYKFDLDGSYAKPYAGIRFTKYDVDSYTVKADGNDFMSNNFDAMTVVSVPVGVQLGTDIMAGDWSLTPSLDLGVTFNLGDTDLSHSAQAVTKTDGMTLTSEVIDDVVFGIKGGLKANYQSLSLGLGLGYEMGSNSDDLSVQGTVKYTF